MSQASVCRVQSAIPIFLVDSRKAWNKPGSEAGDHRILGLIQPLISFVYGLVIGAFTSDSYLKLMESVAQTAYEHLTATGCITVVVQDNGPIHTSSKVQQRWPEWEKQGLYLFFLPKYCSEMNPPIVGVAAAQNS